MILRRENVPHGKALIKTKNYPIFQKCFRLTCLAKLQLKHFFCVYNLHDVHSHMTWHGMVGWRYGGIIRGFRENSPEIQLPFKSVKKGEGLLQAVANITLEMENCPTEVSNGENKNFGNWAQLLYWK